MFLILFKNIGFIFEYYIQTTFYATQNYLSVYLRLSTFWLRNSAYYWPKAIGLGFQFGN